jgi:hypothetical protein
MIRSVLRQRCEPESDWRLHWWGRGWFTFKALVCVALRRESRGHGWDTHGDPGCEDIDVACFNGISYHHWEYGEAHEWDTLRVARRGWHFHVTRDGSP